MTKKVRDIWQSTVSHSKSQQAFGLFAKCLCSCTLHTHKNTTDLGNKKIVKLEVMTDVSVERYSQDDRLIQR